MLPFKHSFRAHDHWTIRAGSKAPFSVSNLATRAVTWLNCNLPNPSFGRQWRVGSRIFPAVIQQEKHVFCGSVWDLRSFFIAVHCCMLQNNWLCQCGIVECDLSLIQIKSCTASLFSPLKTAEHSNRWWKGGVVSVEFMANLKFQLHIQDNEQTRHSTSMFCQRSFLPNRNCNRQRGVEWCQDHPTVGSMSFYWTARSIPKNHFLAERKCVHVAVRATVCRCVQIEGLLAQVIRTWPMLFAGPKQSLPWLSSKNDERLLLYFIL